MTVPRLLRLLYSGTLLPVEDASPVTHMKALLWYDSFDDAGVLIAPG